ncbi:MAG: PAS domain S-box protein [Flavobacterium sp.]
METFNFSKKKFDNLFPFHFVVDNKLNVISVGKSLYKLMPELKEHKSFNTLFSITRPFVEHLTLSNRSFICNQLIVLESKNEKNLFFRGQFEKQQNSILFIGSPWFESIEEISNHNLSLNDFAPHDPLIDLLHVTKNKEIVNIELKELLEKINEQKKTLVTDRKKIDALMLNEKHINEKLKASESRLTSMIYNLQTGVLIEDENRRIVITNQTFCDMFGIPLEPQAMVGFDCTTSAEQTKNLFVESDYFVTRIDEILSKKELVLDEELELKDGRILERRCIPIISNNEYRGHMWSYNDITLDKHYKNSIKKEREKYRSIIDNMNIGLVEVDNDDRILLINQQFAKMSGYSSGVLLGKKPSEVFLDSDNKKIVNEKIDKRLNGESDSYEISLKNANGELREWLVSGAPNYDLNGQVIGSIGLHFDITETKLLAKQKEQLLHRLEQQNQHLMDYAQVVSHDLKSPLRSIHSLVSWIKEDHDKDFNEKTENYLMLIQEKVEKMDSLIEGILDYAKIDYKKTEQETFEVEELLKYIINFIYIPDNISISINGVFPIVKADKHGMQQVFQNIISNAIQHNDKAQGIIEIGCIEEEEQYVFYVKDNGKGIPKKEFKTIFNLFHTLEANSTGIGLSMVKRILEQKNEKIWLESTENVGTTFFHTYQKYKLHGTA